MSGAQAAAEATEATAEILVESYLDLVFEGEDEVCDLTFDKNGNNYCIPVIPQRDGRGKTESSFSPLHLVFVVPSTGEKQTGFSEFSKAQNLVASQHGQVK